MEKDSQTSKSDVELIVTSYRALRHLKVSHGCVAVAYMMKTVVTSVKSLCHAAIQDAQLRMSHQVSARETARLWGNLPGIIFQWLSSLSLLMSQPILAFLSDTSHFSVTSLKKRTSCIITMFAQILEHCFLCIFIVKKNQLILND